MLTGASSRLPLEVISLVLDCVDIAQLLLASRVCARWRAVARSHPLFWRNIRLAGVSQAALDFFEARLNQTTMGGICLSIQLTDIPLAKDVQSVVLSAIARNLGRLRDLRLHLHYEVAPDLLHVLVDAAPRLEYVSLAFYHIPEEQSLVLLPPDLFAGKCAMLKCAALSDVSFPGQPIRAFDHIRSLIIYFGSPRDFNFRLFNHFPALAFLAMFGKSCSGLDQDSSYAISTPIPELNVLEVCLSHRNYHSILPSFPNLSRIPSVKCRQPPMEIAELLITHLDGDIEMDFLCTRHDRVHILLFSPSSGRVRTFIEFASHILEDWPRDVLFERTFVERVTMLRLYAQLAYLAPHFEELPNCHTLKVVVDDTEFPPSLSATPPALLLPALKSIVVELAKHPPIPPRTISASALSAFLTLLVGDREKRPELELQGVSVSGDRETLLSTFQLA